MKKWLFTMVLCVVLCMLATTAVVFASDTVCQNLTSGGKYESVYDAVQAASAGDTIEVYKSYTENKTIILKKNITIKGRTGQEIVTRDTSQNIDSMFEIDNRNEDTGSIMLTIKNIILDGGADWNNSDSAATRTDANTPAKDALIRAMGTFVVNIDEGTAIQNCNAGISEQFSLDAGMTAGAIACQGGETSELNLNGSVIKNCSIKNSEVGKGAGGICCVRRSSSNRMSVSINDSMIINCATIATRENICGGGALFYDCTTHITDAEISENYSFSGGGAFTQYNNVCTITDSKISDNVANKCGGMTVVYGNGECTLDGSTVVSGNHTNNQYSKGGAFYLVNSTTFDIPNDDPVFLHVLGNTKISDNTADFGGGIYCNYCRRLDIGENAEITLNEAKKGGGIYSNGYEGMDTFNIKGSIYQNKAEIEGADIYAEGTSAEIIELPIAGAMHKVFYDPNDPKHTPFDITNWYFDYDGDRFNPYNTEADSYVYGGTLPEGKGYLSLVAASDIRYLVKVTYDKNADDAVGEQIDTKEHLWGDTVTILNEGSMKRPGYSFEKWNTAADGSGTSYSPKDVLTVKSDITLYAQWNEEVNGTPDVDDDTTTLVETGDETNLFMWCAIAVTFLLLTLIICAARRIG